MPAIDWRRETLLKGHYVGFTSQRSDPLKRATCLPLLLILVILLVVFGGGGYYMGTGVGYYGGGGISLILALIVI
jgi:hypothetical protein